MTHQNNYNLSGKLTEELTKNGLGAVPELIRVLINNAMQEERAKYLQADEYERTVDRTGYANGYKAKTIITRVGKITFSIPQVRDSSFYPSALEKGLRSERALTMTLAEMYVQGVTSAFGRKRQADLIRIPVHSYLSNDIFIPAVRFKDYLF